MTGIYLQKKGIAYLLGNKHDHFSYQCSYKIKLLSVRFHFVEKYLYSLTI